MIARCLLTALAAAALAGCQTERFRSQQLGEVDYDTAYQAGRTVFADYYAIDAADPDDGRITGRPKPLDNSAPGGLALSSQPARELAVLRIRRDGKVIWADVRVAIQRQQAGGFDSFGDLGGRGDAPNQTPADLEGPLSASQQEAWVAKGANYRTETHILQDIYNRLHPPAKTPGTEKQE